jgi:hypothetical protein
MVGTLSYIIAQSLAQSLSFNFKTVLKDVVLSIWLGQVPHISKEHSSLLQVDLVCGRETHPLIWGDISFSR